MGFVLSKTAVPLAAISVASIAIGFVSFAFTVATLLRVLWQNFMTLGQAPHEVHSYLTNLRTELLEEKANLRMMRKTIRRHHRMIERGERRDVGFGGEMDDVTLKTMSDVLRSLIKRFSAIERPFLEDGEQGIGADYKHRRRRSRQQSRSDSPYNSSPPEKRPRARSRPIRDQEQGNHHSDTNEEDEAYWAQRTHYCKYTLAKRLRWLSVKSEAQSLFEMLTRVQTRRIARQVAGLSFTLHEYGQQVGEVEGMVRGIEERLNRFVGVRRVGN